MSLPFFYTEEINLATSQFVLNEETSKHVVQVLRMQDGEQLLLTDGKGNLFTAEVTDPNRKKCAVKILSTSTTAPSLIKKTIAISLVKNSNRLEWFLEKATEIGINEIVPLICTRTEKQYFRHDRMKSILVSAMLQSQQSWLPKLQEAVKYNEYVNNLSASEGVQKFIAHCEDGNKVQLTNQLMNNQTNKLILIGPEGDFTTDEITLALQNDFVPASLGETRLRTETAGVVAATLFCLVG